MSDSNQDTILSEFTTVTGVTTDRAKFFLESANWNLQVITKFHVILLKKIANNCNSHALLMSLLLVTIMVV